MNNQNKYLSEVIYLLLIICFGEGLFAQSLFSGAARDSLPADFPDITVSINNNPADGYIFLSNFILEAGVENTPYLLILNNDGSPVFYRKMSSALNLDFKLQPNGIYTYFDYEKGKFYGLNESFAVIDSFYARNGFTADEHELRILPNGNYILLANDVRQINMHEIVPQGNPFAQVIGFVIQEITPAGEVVFEWNTFDHYQITDATDDIDLTKARVDYAHCNAVEIDNDGNLLLSVRYFDEITKINRQTGEIMWRMGGSKCENNEFTFLNDTDDNGFTGFSHQHAVRRLPNNHITLFDNGNLKNPQVSRAVEYEIDETNKTVRKVWEFYHPDFDYTSAMGYVQRLDNGNTIIGWGQNHYGKTVTEVTPEGEITLDLSLPDMVYSYRAYKSMIIPVSVEEKIEKPESFVLYQNYPNPFSKSGGGNSSTTIKYSVLSSAATEYSASRHITLKVFDILGREVATLVNRIQTPGNYAVNFDAESVIGGLPSGVYFYRITSRSDKQSVSEFSDVKKMILLR